MKLHLSSLCESELLQSDGPTAAMIQRLEAPTTNELGYGTKRSLLREKLPKEAKRPSSSAWQREGFVSFLKSQGKTFWTIKQTKNYAIRYGRILDTGDASELLSVRTKHNVLSALANLAKYQGRYQVFLDIRQRYALKWTSVNNSLQSLHRFFNPDLNPRCYGTADTPDDTENPLWR
jgi:hypothetical protein